MTKDNFDPSSEQELQGLENDLRGMFQQVGPTPIMEGFQDELRSKLLQGLEPQTAGTQKKDFFLTSYLTALKKKLSFPSLNFKGRSRQRNLKLVASFALIIFMFTALFWGLGQLGIKPVQAGEIQITALKEDKMGVDVDTAFLLTSQNALDKHTIEENLKISPAFNYKLEKLDGGKQYKIIPQEPLNGNTVYQLSFDVTGQGRDSFSWAFQTKGQFRVLRSLPGKDSSGVPSSSGIEIVLSHENFSVEGAAGFFTISPQVEGRFEKHKKTLVFVPKALQNGTIYTVTMKKGFPLNESNQTLAEDYQFSFETKVAMETEQKFSFEINSNQAEFASTEAPVFPAYYMQSGQVSKAQIDVYRYQDINSFMASQAKLAAIPSWAYYSRSIYQEDLSRLTKHGQFETEIIDTDTYSHYIVFPEKLPPGFYAAQIKVGEAVRQVWFQVSDLAVYLTQGRESSLFWVNDLKSGLPVKGAKVSVAEQSKTWSTDQNGTVLIEGKLTDQQGGFALVQNGTQATVIALNQGFDSDEVYNMRRDYWKYLYVDRELYKPGDTVHYWGVLSPRQGAKELSEVTLEVRGSSGPYYEGAENSPIIEQQVKVEGQTYSGQIQLPILKTGYYYISVKAGEVELLSRGFSVETYTKPSYQLTIEPEKRAIFAGETVNYQVKASFFEGTPVPNLKLNYNLDGQESSVVTDDQGLARITYSGKNRNGYGISSYEYLNVHASLPEAGEIWDESWICVFSSRVNLESKVDRQGNSFTLQAKAQQVGLSKINQGELMYNNYLQGSAPNTVIQGKIIKEIWDKYKTGQYYDYINKKVETQYEYRNSTKQVGEFSVTTGSDGTATYTGQLDDPEASYFIELTAVDSFGQSTKNRVNIYSRSAGSYYGYKYYYLKDQRTTGYNIGENVQLNFMCNEQELADRAHGFLYYQTQKELTGYNVSDQAQYSFPFTTEMNPNTTVAGVYFDGCTYQETNPLVVGVVPESKGLKVTITSDKEEYRPRDKVKLNVQVSDLNGKPVQAEINLNLVDEALFNLAGQEVNLPGSLYRDYIYPQLYTRRTHYHPDYRGGAEQGGEGGGERTDFRDTVLFTTLETGRDGKATTEFTLPDNLTSWRVTYHALTDDLLVASGTEQIPVRLPYFVEVTMNESYHVGDKPILILRSYGEKLANGQSVAYQTSLLTPSGQEITSTGPGVSFTPYNWQLPALEEGVYTLTVTGKSAGLQDTISRKMTVAKPNLNRTISKQELLCSGTKIQGSTETPTLVIFSDYEKSQYLTGLYDLAWTFGSRVEQQLAAREAKKLLKQYFPEENASWFWGSEEESLLKFQQEDGGISILPYGESELALSALVASYDPEDFDHHALAGYFYRILEGEDLKEDDSTLALWGLAALDEPVLLQIKNELQRQDLQPAEKIQLAMALLELGDGAYGKQVFREIIQQYGEDLGASMRIKGPETQDDIVAATTQMALLAARLEEPEKGELYQYILQNPGQEILNIIEQLQILKYSLKYMQSEPVSFTYELNGKSEQKSLKDREVFQLTLLPGDLAKINFSQINGKVGVTCVYSAPLLPGEKGQGEDLSLTRTYSVGNKDAVQAMQRGDLVKVNIEYAIGDKAPNGSYEIVDILPAGLAFVTRPYNRDIKDSNIAYPSEVNGQQLTFNVGKGRGKLSYYARVLTPGEYECGAPYLGSIQSREIYLTGPADRVVIK